MKNYSIIFFVIGAIVAFFCLLISEVKFRPITRLFDNLVMDNKNHYLPCNKLPKITTIDSVVYEHKDIVENIIIEVGKHYRNTPIVPIWEEGSVRDGKEFYIEFRWGSPNGCESTGKGDIEIMYPAHQDRVIIEKIINGDTFFGIPYKLRNV